ncbi:hypothetical protein HK101_011727 [Irineochytrium annulatum]|nr:hypothetical protein HK101_011727 [Irineochytrium annulatum]
MTVLAVTEASQEQYLALAAAIRAIVEDPGRAAREAEAEAIKAEIKSCESKGRVHRDAKETEVAKLAALKKSVMANFVSGNQMADCKHIIAREADLESASVKRVTRLKHDLDVLLAPETRLLTLRTDLARHLASAFLDDKADYGLILRIRDASARRAEIRRALPGRMQASEHLKEALKRTEGLIALLDKEIETDKLAHGGKGRTMVVGQGEFVFTASVEKVDQQIKDALKADRSIPQPKLATVPQVDENVKGAARERAARDRALLRLHDRASIIRSCLNHVESHAAEESAELDRLEEEQAKAVAEMQARRVAVFEEAIKARGGVGAGIGWQALVAHVTGDTDDRFTDEGESDGFAVSEASSAVPAPTRRRWGLMGSSMALALSG